MTPDPAVGIDQGPGAVSAVEQRAEALKAIIRKYSAGGCRMLSLGDACECPLCIVDGLLALVADLRQQQEHLQAHYDALERNTKRIIGLHVDAERQARAAEASLTAHLKYAQHLAGCGWQNDDTFDRDRCTCGLSELLQQSQKS